MQNQDCRLYISATAGNPVNSDAIRGLSGWGVNHSGFPTFTGVGSELVGWSKSAMGHTRTGPYDVGDIVLFFEETLGIQLIVVWAMKKRN